MDTLDTRICKKFYYIQDTPWVKWLLILPIVIIYLVIYLMYLFFIIQHFSWFRLLTCIAFFAVGAIPYWLYIRKDTRPVLTFYPNFLLIKRKKYLYTDIENYWVGEGIYWGTIGRRGPRRWDISNKMLYIRIKHRLSAYQFSLEHSFTEKDGDEIIKQFQIHNIYNYVGNTLQATKPLSVWMTILWVLMKPFQVILPVLLFMLVLFGMIKLLLKVP